MHFYTLRRHLSRSNRHWMREEHIKYSGKVIVWVVIIGDQDIGYSDDNLQGNNNLAFLQSNVVPTSANLCTDQVNTPVPANTT